MVGDGIVTFGVFVATDSGTESRGLDIPHVPQLPGDRHARRREVDLSSLVWNFVAMPPEIATPSSACRKST